MAVCTAVTTENSELDLNTEIQAAKALAREAGAAILGHYHSEHRVHIEYKDEARSDPVTAADKDANDLIVAGLRQAFPRDAILAEESEDNSDRRNHRRLWCVDPLDGTREFIARNGMFVVMIGLAIDGRAKAGVVYQPTEDLLYWGTPTAAGMEHAGKVAALDLSTADQTSGLTMMISRSHRSERLERIAEAMGGCTLSPMGSVGLKVGQVAAGAAQLYVSLTDRTMEWDACAPEAVLVGAGGRMSDTNGQPLIYNKAHPNTPHGMVGTSKPIYRRVMDCVAAELV